jgi:hypothetical protein
MGGTAAAASSSSLNASRWFGTSALADWSQKHLAAAIGPANRKHTHVPPSVAAVRALVARRRAGVIVPAGGPRQPYPGCQGGDDSGAGRAGEGDGDASGGGGGGGHALRADRPQFCALMHTVGDYDNAGAGGVSASTPAGGSPARFLSCAVGNDAKLLL